MDFDQGLVLVRYLNFTSQILSNRNEISEILRAEDAFIVSSRVASVTSPLGSFDIW